MCDKVASMKRAELVRECKKYKENHGGNCGGPGATNDAIRALLVGVLCNGLKSRVADVKSASEQQLHDLEEKLRAAKNKNTQDDALIDELRQQIERASVQIEEKTKSFEQELQNLEAKFQKTDSELQQLRRDKGYISSELHQMNNSWEQLLSQAQMKSQAQKLKDGPESRAPKASVSKDRPGRRVREGSSTVRKLDFR
jgi:DNA repair exonuclease SbcCD ATPase subunit